MPVSAELQKVVQAKRRTLQFLQTLPETKLSEQYLENQQTRERSEFLILKKADFRFMTVKGRVGATQFIEFIKRLLHNVPRMVFLIVDGHPGGEKCKTFCRISEGSFSTFLSSSVFAGIEP